MAQEYMATIQKKLHDKLWFDNQNMEMLIKGSCTFVADSGITAIPSVSAFQDSYYMSTCLDCLHEGVGVAVKGAALTSQR